MEEPRRHVRLAARAEVTYTVLPSGTPQRAVSKDLSAGGLSLFTERPLPPGASVQVAVSLPGREQPVNAIAETVWSREHEVTDKAARRRSVETAVRFTEMAPKDRDAVAQHITRALQAPGIS